MNKFHVLLNIKLKGLYVAWGDYRNLIPIFVVKTGWQGFVERCFLRCQFYLPHFSTATLDGLVELGNLPQKGCVYKTAWYQQKSWIGIVDGDHGKAFLRYYKNSDDAYLYARQIQFINEFYSGSFIIPKLLQQTGKIVACEIVDRKRSVTSRDHLDIKLLKVCQDFLSRMTMRKPIISMIPADFFLLYDQAGYSNITSKLFHWRSLQNEMETPIIPVHGDMTPWNVFVHPDEKIVLVDYDRAGWHVPYYDVFHYIFQPQALRKKHMKLSYILSVTSWFTEDLKTYLILYFINQLYHDMTDKYINHYQHKSLNHIIANKMLWLEEALND